MERLVFVLAIIVFFFFCWILVLIVNRNGRQSDQIKNEEKEIPLNPFMKQGEGYVDVYYSPMQTVQRLKNISPYERVTATPLMHVKNASKVNKGDRLISIVFKTRSLVSTVSTGNQWYDREIIIDIESPVDGYVILPKMDFLYDLSRDLFVATIYETYEGMLGRAFEFSFSIEYDVLSNTKYIEWKKVNGDDTQFLSIANFRCLSFSFSVKEDAPIMLVKYIYKTIRGTLMEILFEDNTNISFPLNGNLDNHNAIQVPLLLNDIECLRNKKASLIRINQNENYTDLKISLEDSIALCRFVETYIVVLNEMGVKIPVTNEKKEKNNSSCWVYLMHDTINNAFKIGISNNPCYRERTLQSEKPFIEKLSAREYPSRTIARSIESSLHKVYEAKHLRGEWFKLGNDDVEEIKNILR